MYKKLAISLAVAGCLRIVAFATTVSVTSPTVPIMIPDYNNNGVSGLAESITLNNTGIENITGVQLTLDISSGFNGDYYAYLVHDNSPIAILLNRVGLDATHPYGYNNGGFDVTFSDSAANGDVHTYQNLVNPSTGQLTGTWQPDGRSASPFQVATSDPRTSLLSVLDGGSADGTWTLFIADTSEGGIGTLEGWSLEVTGTGGGPALPDTTSTLTLLGLAIGLLLFIRRGSYSKKATA